MIAITGIGAVSVLGIGKEAQIKGVLDPNKGTALPNRIEGFEPKKFLPPLKARRMSRFSILALASAVEAINDSKLNIEPLRTGVFVGTGLSSTESTDLFYESLLEGGPLNQNPIVFPETVQNIAASHIAIHFGIKGPNTTFSQNEISSELAIFYGIELLKDGSVDSVIVSGVEEMSNALLDGYRSLRVVSKKSLMMPFDRKRDGFVPTEGSATLVLERAQDAKKRGANIYAFIASLGFSSAPVERLRYDTSGSSMRDSMAGAIKNLDMIDMISASANSSRELDGAEARAIKEVFGRSIPVTAIRSHLGFFISDGALRIAITALCMKEGIIPPILNLTEPIEDINFVVNRPLRADLRACLLNSFSSGGAVASVVLINPHI